MRARWSTLSLLVVLVLLVPITSATALITAVGGLVGTAEVGQWFLSSSPCDEQGQGTPQGSGVAPITAPTPHSREGAWHLLADVTAIGQVDAIPGVYTGTLEMCGRLDREPLFNRGPVCGISKGFDGRGRAFAFDQAIGGLVELRLYDFGWKEQAGAILPVIGNFERLDEFGNQTGDTGTAIALVAVAPPVTALETCGGYLAGNGVKSVEVVAAFALSSAPEKDWNDLTGYVLPKSGSDAKSCFADGPDEKAPATPPASGTGYC